MEVLFFAVLLGCSDDLTVCDEVSRHEVEAVTADLCAERMLEREEARKVDYPSVRAECRPAEQLVAESS